MRRLPLVIGLFVMVFVAMVTGCGHAPRYDSRLTAADSLMQTAPDSALAIVEALNPDSLTTEGDRAYRDLLVTQARYKCYIVATSDSDINRALEYYRRHSGEREKLTRAYIYKGAVVEELGQPDSAMLYYKQAEATAAPDDYFNLGYTNLRIAELYQRVYFKDSAVISRMKSASRYFEAIADTNYLITAIGTQGDFVEYLGKDSARQYLEKAISLAKAIRSTKQFDYQSKLAGLHFYDNDFRKAKDLAMNIVRNGREDCNENQFYYYAARSYLKLGLIDSARWVKSLIPDPVSEIDSMNQHLLLAELSEADRQSDGYARHRQASDQIQKRIMKASLKSNLATTELEYNAEQRETQMKNQSNARLAIIIGGFLLAILAILLYLYFNKHRYDRLIAEMKQDNATQLEDLSHLEQRIDELQIQDTQLKNFIESHTDMMRDVMEACYHDPRNRLTSELKQIIKYQGKNDHMWSQLYHYIDMKYNNIMTHTMKEYPQLNEKEVLLIALSSLGYSYIETAIIMGYSNATSVGTIKTRLAEKMGLKTSLSDYILAFSK